MSVPAKVKRFAKSFYGTLERVRAFSRAIDRSAFFQNKAVMNKRRKA
jgi:hypothetical protein